MAASSECFFPLTLCRVQTGPRVFLRDLVQVEKLKLMEQVPTWC